jgi:RNA polymerase sigma factor (sigma-70 family)
VTADGRFATTRWSIVNVAGHQSDPRADAALSELCHIYWPPLYGYLRRRGYDIDKAQDLTQGFFARLLERQSIRTADPRRGRFRSFLLIALKRFVINEHEHDMAVRRGGRHAHLALDFDDAERTYVLDSRTDDTPESVFDRKWAAITLDRALHRLNEECSGSGKIVEARALIPYLTESTELPPYKTVAAQLGMTEGAVKVAVHRLRQRFGAMLRAEISDTVSEQAEIDDEMRELIRVVSR